MKMLPRLHAEEQLSAIEAVAVACGHYEQQDRKAVLDRMRKAVGGGDRAAPAGKADGAQLAAMGIGMTLVPAPVEARTDG